MSREPFVFIPRDPECQGSPISIYPARSKNGIPDVKEALSYLSRVIPDVKEVLKYLSRALKWDPGCQGSPFCYLSRAITDAKEALSDLSRAIKERNCGCQG
jgi:hypothetical protein